MEILALITRVLPALFDNKLGNWSRARSSPGTNEKARTVRIPRHIQASKIYLSDNFCREIANVGPYHNFILDKQFIRLALIKALSSL